MPRKVQSFLAKSNSCCNSLSQAQLSPSLDTNAPFFCWDLSLKGESIWMNSFQIWLLVQARTTMRLLIC